MNDTFGMIGLGLIATGVSARFGWELACIIMGVLFLVLAIIGALRK